jgi:signal transduction histidine kinase
LPEASAISLVKEDKSIVFLTLRPFGSAGLVTTEIASLDAVFTTAKPTVSGPFKAPINDNIIVTVGVPILRDGKVVYCLRMVLRTTALSDLLLAQGLPETWMINIVAGNGKVVARTRAPELFVGKLVREDIRAVLRTASAKLLDSTSLEGDAVKVAVAPLNGWDWSVTIGVPAVELKRNEYQAYRLLAIFGTVIAILAALFNYAIAGRVGAPKAGALAAGIVAHPQSLGRMWPAAIALAIALVLSVMAALINQHGLEQARKLADQQRAASHQRTQIIELLSLFKDIETGQRGYVITGRESFLEPYQVATKELPVLLTSLLLSKQQIEGYSWGELEAVAASRQAFAAQAIAERRDKGEAVLQDTKLFEQGKLAMDKLRLQLGTLEDLLGKRVESMTQLAEEERVRSIELQWLSTLAAGLLVAFSLAFWLFERRRNKLLLSELANSNELLESRVQRRTQQLEVASSQIRSFGAESQRRIESERKRLSREVHDQIGQVFTGIKMILNTLTPGSLAEDQQKALASALDMGINTTRRIAAELRPPLLDDLGLRAALDLYLRTQVVPAGMSFDLDIPSDHGLNGEQSTQLFRIAQEASTNSIRHGHASHISILLQIKPDVWEMQVDDDGIGVDTTQIRAGALGLVGIQERAQMLGGDATVKRRPEGGTRVEVHIPKRRAP